MVVGGEMSTEADANIGDPPVPNDESSTDGNTPTNDVAEDQFHGKCGLSMCEILIYRMARQRSYCSG